MRQLGNVHYWIDAEDQGYHIGLDGPKQHKRSANRLSPPNRAQLWLETFPDSLRRLRGPQYCGTLRMPMPQNSRFLKPASRQPVSWPTSVSLRMLAYTGVSNPNSSMFLSNLGIRPTTRGARAFLGFYQGCKSATPHPVLSPYRGQANAVSLIMDSNKVTSSQFQHCRLNRSLCCRD